jgi:hypothetical protein
MSSNFHRGCTLRIAIEIMIVMILLMVSSAGAATLVVDSNVIESNNDNEMGILGTTIIVYPTIQAAINAANDGDTISVMPGTYDQRITINKSLSLIGATSGVNKKGYGIYDPASESILRPTTPLEAPVVNIKADNVTFDGFVVAYEVAQSGGVYQDLVQIDPYTSVTEGIQIINNVLGPNTNIISQDGTKGRSGITVLGPRTLPLKNLLIENNKIFDVAGNGSGILIEASYSTEYSGRIGFTDMAGSSIENNEITGTHRSGIELAGGVNGTIPDGFLIKDNLITNNGFGGIPDAANLKYGNGIMMIRGSGDMALANPSGSRYVTILNNTIIGNEKNGIYLGSQNRDIYVENNSIENNGEGISGYNSWDGIRADLNESYYTGHTIRYDILQNIQVHNNSILGNGNEGINVTEIPTQGPVNATYNWWGDDSGPGTVGPGSGDRVSLNVLYDPWLPDTPPASVTNLMNVSYASNYINWTWADPANIDFNGVKIYLDGIYTDIVIAKGVQHYNATVFPGTHTIGTITVDVRGNENATMVTNTSTTILPEIRFINGTVFETGTSNGILGVTVSNSILPPTTTNETGFYSLAVGSGDFILSATLDPAFYPNSTIPVSTIGEAVVLKDIALDKKPTGNITGSVTIG